MANRIELGEYRAIESTGACSERCSFSQALTEGERFVREASESMRVLDVRAARRSGIHPLPDLLDAKQGASLDTRRPVKNTPWKVVQPTALPPLPKVNRTRSQERLDDWQKRLLDLTLRNRLLNDREKLGIPLMIAGDEPLAHLEDLLWTEKPMKLVARGSTRLTTENVAAQARVRSENEFDAAGMIAELNRSWLRSTLDDGELFNRATKAFREAKSSLEETGARSLYIAIGFLEFRVEPRDTPVQAPLLLVPMEMQRILLVYCVFGTNCRLTAAANGGAIPTRCTASAKVALAGRSCGAWLISTCIVTGSGMFKLQRKLFGECCVVRLHPLQNHIQHGRRN
jgi:hypothetical protein